MNVESLRSSRPPSSACTISTHHAARRQQQLQQRPHSLARPPVNAAPGPHRTLRCGRGTQVRAMQAGRPMPGSSSSMPPGGSSSAQDRPGPLVRRSPAPQTVYLERSQVVNKQVITRTTGRNLGVVGDMWVDPIRREVVSLDLDEKRTLSSTRVANVPLSSLRQIGDVVLVHDETALYEQDLDGRLGYVVLTGMEVRTRSGDFLGKVRDFSFSPDTGEISRLSYDEFGLSFLPLNFFDCFSLPMADVMTVGRSEVIVYDEAKYRERKETSGLFAAIPSILKTLNGRPTPGAAVATTADAYRSDGYLPKDYTYEQWQYDLKRWEQETGMTYDQYLRSQQQPQQPQQQPRAQPRASLPAPGRSSQPYPGMADPRAARQQQQQQQYASYAAPGASYAQQGSYRGQPADAGGAYRQQMQYTQPPGTSRPAPQDPRTRSGNPASPSQQQQQQQQPQQQYQPRQQFRPQASPQSSQPPLQRQQLYAQQQQQPAEPSGRPLEEWLVREDRPRFDEVLEGAGGAPTYGQSAAASSAGQQRPRGTGPAGDGRGSDMPAWDGVQQQQRPPAGGAGQQPAGSSSSNGGQPAA